MDEEVDVQWGKCVAGELRLDKRQAMINLEMQLEVSLSVKMTKCFAVVV